MQDLSLRPDVYSERNPLLGSPLSAVANIVPVIVGKTNGGLATVSDEAVTKGAQGSIETLANSGVDSISEVNLSAGGPGDYTEDIDFQKIGDTIKWLGTKLVRPTLATPVIGSGGSLDADTYYYVITAIRTVNVTGPVVGETNASVEATVVVPDPSSKVTLSWAAVPLAEGYRIYRSDVSGSYTDKLLAEVVGGSTLTYVDLGGAVGTGTPPATNSAYKEPATGSTYYVTYEYLKYMYQEFKRYYNLTDVANDHGITSDVYKAAVLIMGPAGYGSNAGQVAVVGVEDDADADFIDALTLLQDYGDGEQFHIALMRYSSVLFSAARTHVDDMSSVENKKYRRVYLGMVTGSIPGDAGTPGTMIYYSRSMNDERVCVLDQPDFVANVQQEDGSFEEETLNGYFLAALVVGAAAALDTPASSLTGFTLSGIVSLGATYSEPQKKNNVLNGLMCVEAEGSNFIVRRDITTSRTSVETQQRNISVADDDVKLAIESDLKLLRGKGIDDGLLEAAKSIARTTLSNKVKSKVIRGFNSNALTAVQGTGSQKTWVIIQGSYQPIYICEVVLFQYGYDLT